MILLEQCVTFLRSKYAMMVKLSLIIPAKRRYSTTISPLNALPWSTATTALFHQRTPLITFSDVKILDIIRSLDPNKSCGWDGASPRMIKICDSSIVTPIKIIFETCISEGIFPEKWKMSNVCPVQKKEAKNLKENYRPISLLPILGKFFEKVLYQ